jgi:hypothetical protein
MMGATSFDIDIGNNANSLELTAEVTDSGSIILDQCSIEWMAAPPPPPQP